MLCGLLAEFLVKFLEQEVCRLHWDVGFVTVTMQEIGVQLPRLLEVYDQLFKTRVRSQPPPPPRLALFTPLCFLTPFVFSPEGPLLAAAAEAAPPGGVHPRAAAGVRRRPQQSAHL